MRNLWKSVLGLWVIGMGLGVSAPAQAASANGPYYATPSWDQKLDANTRFVVLLNWNSEAVLDRETGLVWEQSPSTSTFIWETAQFHCNNRSTGGRLGWQLPTVQQLASLVDPNVSPGPTLPSGHPFPTVQSSFYWSATTFASDSSFALGVLFSAVGVFFDVKTTPYFAWCVRGGQGVDAQ